MICPLPSLTHSLRHRGIYIDPPYNTGNDFIYPDNFTESLETYLQYTGQVDAEGRKFSTNTEADGRFHSKWLNMMYPRLFLARNLLREDGVIFVSIDDAQVDNLRKLCNEVFGEENFVACIVWQKTYSPANDKKGIDAMHDFVLCYQKSDAATLNLFPRTAKQDDAYSNPDDDPRGLWKAVDATRAEHRDYAFFAITTPGGREVFPAQGRSWVFNKEELPELLADKRLWFGKDGASKPSKKLFLSEVKPGVVPTSWWSHEDAGHNDEAKKELKSLLAEGLPFETPKPTRLIQRALLLATTKDGNDLVPKDAEQLGKQLEMHVQHIEAGRTQEDILFEILLKSGFPLSTRIEPLTLAGKSVYSIAEGAMLVCLEKELNPEVIKEMAARKPERVVCLDAGFAGNDQLKTNAAQTFKDKGVTSFRTV